MISKQRRRALASLHASLALVSSFTLSRMDLYYQMGEHQQSGSFGDQQQKVT